MAHGQGERQSKTPTFFLVLFWSFTVLVHASLVGAPLSVVERDGNSNLHVITLTEPDASIKVLTACTWPHPIGDLDFDVFFPPVIVCAGDFLWDA